MVDVTAPMEPGSWDDADSWTTVQFDECGRGREIDHLAGSPMGPGTVAGIARLQSLDLAAPDLLLALKERVRAHSHFQALVYEDMAAIADAYHDAVDPELAFEAASAEIRAALRLTRRSADHELDMALALRDRVPMVLGALKAGDIDHRRAITIVRGTSHLTVEMARMVATEVLGPAARLTTGQLRERLRRLAFDIDPDDATRRYEHASEQRRVELEPTDDGTGNLLILDAPPDRAVAARRHIDAIARSLRSPDEPRTIDQLRADVALDLLSGELPEIHATTTPPSRSTGGSVDLTVDLATLAGLEHRAGEIGGFGPVVADIARKIAESQRHTTWRFNVTDPHSGQSLVTGTTRRRPTAEQRRAVSAGHPNCVFPGCRAPAADCDIDHRKAWVDFGPTVEENLAPLCRHDHRLKHEYGWKLIRLLDGDHAWTSPLGHTYTTSGRSP